MKALWKNRTIYVILVASLVLLVIYSKNLETKAQEISGQPTPPGNADEFVAASKGTVDVEGGIIQMSARKDGIIKEVLVEEGDKVKEGQILAIQENEQEKLQLELAKSDIEQLAAQLAVLETKYKAAKREQERLAPLVKIEAVASNEYDKAFDQVKELDAEIKSAKINIKTSQAKLKVAEYEIEQHTIRAPVNGIILRKLARPGVGASTLNVSVLFWLIPDEQKIIRTQLEEKYLSSTKVGSVASISVDSDESKVYIAEVIRVGKVLAPKSLTVDAIQDAYEDKFFECILRFKENNELLIGQNVLIKFKNADNK